MTVSDLRVLVENLDEYIHIPGGIERIKKTVLHLAVSGQLVVQDPSEGTGEELYHQIQAVHKPKKPLPDIEDAPFDIPDNWKWVNLAEIVEINIGKTPSRTEPKYWGNDVQWVSIADLSDNNHISETKERISNLGLEKCFKGTAVPSGTLLYSFKLTIGKMSIIDMDAVHNEAIASLITHSPITTEYLFKALKIIDPLSKSNSAVMGKTLNSQSLAVIEVPLPPLGEQKRIVEKLDEIFALIDELQGKYEAEEAERSKFVRSSLRALSHDKSTLALDNLAQTIKTKADAAELRKAILHLAVSGQLVSQIPSEGTCEDLYKQIQAELSGFKKRKPLPEIADEEIPFDIPKSWKWARLADISKNLSAGGDKPKDFTKEKTEQNTVPVIANGETNEGIIGFTKEARVTEISVTVSGRGTIGYSVVRDYPYTPIVRLLVITPPGGVLPQYIQFVFSSLFEGGLGTSIPQLTVPMITPKPIPLPPLPEQERIVQKTTELLGLVNELEKHLEK